MSENIEPSDPQQDLSASTAEPTVESLDVYTYKTDAKESRVSQSKVEGVRRQREKTRGELANRLLWLIIGTAIGSFILVTIDLVHDSATTQDSDIDTDFASDVITLLITTQSTLAGSAIGFYFGNKQSDDK